MAHDGGGLRRKDTTKGPPLRILSLDGGGVRGYSMLIILQEMMHRTFVEIEGRAPQHHEIPKPCDTFDLIVGTGTGGLIAIMLGRLRLDIDTCKNVYVRMTRKVFETDKTFAGIPYRGTLFKASKLEEAIKECVSQHTIYDDEGNDTLASAEPMSPNVPGFNRSPNGTPQRNPSSASRYSQVGMSPIQPRTTLGRWGEPNALLYDLRENRTKTAVTAVYKHTRPGDAPALLRSYDSRKEPAPDVNCTIWQAGRATAATGLAFKPIQIGQSIYIDEGPGKYNPAPQVLDEALVNEWPGREIGVFVSIGTGKRPGGTGNTQHLWWESFVGGAMGDFAEARRRLINKIEGCEETHQYMLREYLARMNVDPSTYFRFNVEVGVGEFGMNEWNRLNEISTNTRRYLARREVTDMNTEVAAKLAKVHFAKRRQDRHLSNNSIQSGQERWDRPLSTSSIPPPANLAVELPAEDVLPSSQHAYGPGPRQFRPSASMANMKYTVISSDEYPQPVDSPNSGEQAQHRQNLPYRQSTDSARRSNASFSTTSPKLSPVPQSPQQQGAPRTSPPPLPPKTPLPYPDEPHSPRTFSNMGSITRPSQSYDNRNSASLPYPDEAPPPMVNVARKPEYGVR